MWSSQEKQKDTKEKARNGRNGLSLFLGKDIEEPPPVLSFSLENDRMNPTQPSTNKISPRRKDTLRLFHSVSTSATRCEMIALSSFAVPASTDAPCWGCVWAGVEMEFLIPPGLEGNSK